jgi:hypothetical protein
LHFRFRHRAENGGDPVADQFFQRFRRHLIEVIAIGVATQRLTLEAEQLPKLGLLGSHPIGDGIAATKPTQ